MHSDLDPGKGVILSPAEGHTPIHIHKLVVNESSKVKIHGHVQEVSIAT